MSFILDAIAKSERERQQQEIPDARILAMPVSDNQRPRQILPYLVVGALLLSVIVLLIWLQTDGSLFSRFSQTENNTIEPSAANQPVAPDNVVPENQASEVENANSTAPEIQVVEIDRAQSQKARAKTSIPDPVPQTTQRVGLDKSFAEIKAESYPRVEDAQAGSKDKLEPAPPQKMAKNRDGNSNRSVPVEPNTESGVIGAGDLANQNGMQNVAKPAPRKVIRLSELPADVRRDLPPVAFTGHLFSKNVNVSYVLVDGGRSVIAGQLIVDDLFLHEVTPTGAIVDFRGFLIEVGILQNWSLK